MKDTEAAILRAAMYLNDCIEEHEPLELPPAVRHRYERLRKALAAEGLIRCSTRPTGVAEAMASAIAIQADPLNRSIRCTCGAEFLSGAAEKSASGSVVCPGCGAHIYLPGSP